jgi:hypothetical protein
MTDGFLYRRVRDLREVRIETESDAGATHRTIIWVVVDGDDRILARSWRGRGARWFREATSGRPVALVIGGVKHPVAVEAATDPDRIASYDAALEAKYAGNPSTPAMLSEEIVDTTLELRPLGA